MSSPKKSDIPAETLELYEELIATKLEIERKGARKVYDLATCLPEGARVSEEDGRSVVSLTVRMGAQGSLRPDALVREALRRSGMSDELMSVTRTGLRPEEARA